MNREMVSKAIHQIDEGLVAGAMTYRGRTGRRTPERNVKMEKTYTTSGHRKLAFIALAACLALALAVTAYAANLWGIREMWSRPGGELPEAAAERIEPRGETGQAEGWSARVTESYCDSDTVLLTVEVSGGEGYVLVPTDAMPEDPVSYIGLTGDETLADYAAAQGRELLMVGAMLEGPDGLGYTASQHFESVSDGELVILIEAKKSASAPQFDAVCTVYALRAGGEQAERVEIPLTLTQTEAEELGRFVPADPDAVADLHIGEAAVTKTPLGLSVTFPITEAYGGAITRLGRMECDELTGHEGGCALDDDGVWRVRWTMGRGEISDTLTVHFYGQEDEPLGDVVFQK